MHNLTRTLTATVALALAAAAPAAAAASGGSLSSARAGTAGFHNNDAAVAAGYGEFADAQGIACIDKAGPDGGGMGIHYVNLDLVGDDVVSAGSPEALVYEPTRNGRLRLVAAEYIVFQSAWDETHDYPPSLFGQEFELTEAGNRYGIPAFYELHAWLWKHNPGVSSNTSVPGMFQDWNPLVSCRFG